MFKSGEFKFKVIPFSLVASFSTSCSGADDICIPLCVLALWCFCVPIWSQVSINVFEVLTRSELGDINGMVVGEM